MVFVRYTTEELGTRLEPSRQVQELSNKCPARKLPMIQLPVQAAIVREQAAREQGEGEQAAKQSVKEHACKQAVRGEAAGRGAAEQATREQVVGEYAVTEQAVQIQALQKGVAVRDPALGETAEGEAAETQRVMREEVDGEAVLREQPVRVQLASKDAACILPVAEQGAIKHAAMEQAVLTNVSCGQVVREQLVVPHPVREHPVNQQAARDSPVRQHPVREQLIREQPVREQSNCGHSAGQQETVQQAACEKTAASVLVREQVMREQANRGQLMGEQVAREESPAEQEESGEEMLQVGDSQLLRQQDLQKLQSVRENDAHKLGAPGSPRQNLRGGINARGLRGHSSHHGTPHNSVQGMQGPTQINSLDTAWGQFVTHPQRLIGLVSQPPCLLSQLVWNTPVDLDNFADQQAALMQSSTQNPHPQGYSWRMPKPVSPKDSPGGLTASPVHQTDLPQFHKALLRSSRDPFEVPSGHMLSPTNFASHAFPENQPPDSITSLHASTPPQPSTSMPSNPDPSFPPSCSLSLSLKALSSPEYAKGACCPLTPSSFNLINDKPTSTSLSSGSTDVCHLGPEVNINATPFPRFHLKRLSLSTLSGVSRHDATNAACQPLLPPLCPQSSKQGQVAGKRRLCEDLSLTGLEPFAKVPRLSPQEDETEQADAVCKMRETDVSEDEGVNARQVALMRMRDFALSKGERSEALEIRQLGTPNMGDREASESGHSVRCGSGGWGLMSEGDLIEGIVREGFSGGGAGVSGLGTAMKQKKGDILGVVVPESVPTISITLNPLRRSAPPAGDVIKISAPKHQNTCGLPTPSHSNSISAIVNNVTSNGSRAAIKDCTTGREDIVLSPHRSPCDRSLPTDIRDCTPLDADLTTDYAADNRQGITNYAAGNLDNITDYTAGNKDNITGDAAGNRDKYTSAALHTSCTTHSRDNVIGGTAGNRDNIIGDAAGNRGTSAALQTNCTSGKRDSTTEYVANNRDGNPASRKRLWDPLPATDSMRCLRAKREYSNVAASTTQIPQLQPPTDTTFAHSTLPHPESTTSAAITVPVTYPASTLLAPLDSSASQPAQPSTITPLSTHYPAQSLMVLPPALLQTLHPSTSRPPTPQPSVPQSILKFSHIPVTGAIVSASAQLPSSRAMLSPHKHLDAEALEAAEEQLLADMNVVFNGGTRAGVGAGTRANVGMGPGVGAATGVSLDMAPCASIGPDAGISFHTGSQYEGVTGITDISRTAELTGAATAVAVATAVATASTVSHPGFDSGLRTSIQSLRLAGATNAAICARSILPPNFAMHVGDKGHSSSLEATQSHTPNLDSALDQTARLASTAPTAITAAGDLSATATDLHQAGTRSGLDTRDAYQHPRPPMLTMLPTNKSPMPSPFLAMSNLLPPSSQHARGLLNCSASSTRHDPGAEKASSTPTCQRKDTQSARDIGIATGKGFATGKGIATDTGMAFGNSIASGDSIATDAGLATGAGIAAANSIAADTGIATYPGIAAGTVIRTVASPNIASNHIVTGAAGGINGSATGTAVPRGSSSSLHSLVMTSGAPVLLHTSATLSPAGRSPDSKTPTTLKSPVLGSLGTGLAVRGDGSTLIPQSVGHLRSSHAFQALVDNTQRLTARPGAIDQAPHGVSHGASFGQATRAGDQGAMQGASWQGATCGKARMDNASQSIITADGFQTIRGGRSGMRTIISGAGKQSASSSEEMRNPKSADGTQTITSNGGVQKATQMKDTPTLTRSEGIHTNQTHQDANQNIDFMPARWSPTAISALSAAFDREKGPLSAARQLAIAAAVRASLAETSSLRDPPASSAASLLKPAVQGTSPARQVAVLTCSSPPGEIPPSSGVISASFGGIGRCSSLPGSCAHLRFTSTPSPQPSTPPLGTSSCGHLPSPSSTMAKLTSSSCLQDNPPFSCRPMVASPSSLPSPPHTSSHSSPPLEVSPNAITLPASAAAACSSSPNLVSNTRMFWDKEQSMLGMSQGIPSFMQKEIRLLGPSGTSRASPRISILPGTHLSSLAATPSPPPPPPLFDQPLIPLFAHSESETMHDNSPASPTAPRATSIKPRQACVRNHISSTTVAGNIRPPNHSTSLHTTKVSSNPQVLDSATLPANAAFASSRAYARNTAFASSTALASNTACASNAACAGNPGSFRPSALSGAASDLGNKASFKAPDQQPLHNHQWHHTHRGDVLRPCDTHPQGSAQRHGTTEQAGTMERCSSLQRLLSAAVPGNIPGNIPPATVGGENLYLNLDDAAAVLADIVSVLLAAVARLKVSLVEFDEPNLGKEAVQTLLKALEKLQWVLVDFTSGRNRIGKRMSRMAPKGEARSLLSCLKATHVMDEVLLVLLVVETVFGGPLQTVLGSME